MQNNNDDQSRVIYGIGNNQIYNYSIPCGDSSGYGECKWKPVEFKDIENVKPVKVFQGKHDIWAIDDASGIYRCSKPCDNSSKWKNIPSPSQNVSDLYFNDDSVFAIDGDTSYKCKNTAKSQCYGPSDSDDSDESSEDNSGDKSGFNKWTIGRPNKSDPKILDYIKSNSKKEIIFNSYNKL